MIRASWHGLRAFWTVFCATGEIPLAVASGRVVANAAYINLQGAK